MLIKSSGTAVGICAFTTAFWSSSSSRRTGTMLKFAAIGVIKAQIGTAIPLFAVNVLLIYFLAF